MSQEIEIEFKNMLTKEEFKKLKQILSLPNNTFSQTNYYFETIDFSLLKKQSALRIREKNKQYIATLKQPYEDALLESHVKLTRKQFKQSIENQFVSLDPIHRQLNDLEIDHTELQYQGLLQTLRQEMNYRDCLLVLDKSIYNGQLDYELELETDSYSYGEKVFIDLLNKFDIPQRNTPNKVARFFKTK